VNKDVIEFLARSNAGIKENIDGYNLVTVLGDIPMLTMPGDESVSPHLEREGFWESWITTWLYNNLNEGSLFVDIGANTGYYSFFAARQGAKVLAVEANPKYVELIRRSRTYNGFHFPVYNIALSDRAGTVTLSIPDHLHGSASIMLDFVGSQWGGTNIKVQSMTLDSMLLVAHQRPSTIIKIDAEGAEEKIFNGMCNTLVDRRPTLMLEWTPKAYTEKFYDNVLAYGDIYFINHDGGETPVDREWIESQADWVMVAVHPR
jgi:FkbM family methyltransferase